METIFIDYSNWKQLRNLMDRHKEFDTMLIAHNSKDELCETSILSDHIIVKVYQNNDWIRRDIYWYDGTREELYDGTIKKIKRKEKEIDTLRERIDELALELDELYKEC